MAIPTNRKRQNHAAQNYARLKSLLYRQTRQNNGTMSGDLALRYKGKRDTRLSVKFT